MKPLPAQEGPAPQLARPQAGPTSRRPGLWAVGGRTVSARLKRAQQPGRELEEVRETDLDGRIVVRHRTVDSLRKLLRSGAITEAMHDAGRAFQRDFQFAGLDPIRARPMMCHVAEGAHRSSPRASWTRGDACTKRWRRWAGSAARRAAACGTSWAAAARLGSGRSAKAGAGAPAAAGAAPRGY